MDFNIIERIKKFMRDSKRVLKLARNPTLKETRLTIRISALGVVVIGFAGFGVKLLFDFIMFILTSGFIHNLIFP
ncbi:MAG: protein translocase SEC61 complex subunit gamma [Candidatus Helarchaeales archaeon]